MDDYLIMFTYGAFPTLIHITNIPNFENIKDDLVKYCYEQRKKDPEGRRISNAGGWQSVMKYGDFDNIIISNLKEALGGYFMNDSKRIIDPKFGLESGGVWININGKGSYNTEHNHPKCDLAGVLWIKVPKPHEESGNLVLNNPDLFTRFQELEVYTNEVQEEFSQVGVLPVEPVEGRIVMFPASLKHRVDENMLDEDRISVSFNLKFTIDMSTKIDYGTRGYGRRYYPKGTGDTIGVVAKR